MSASMPVFRNLETFIDYSVALTKGHGRDPNRFVRMRREHGTIKAVSILVMSGTKDDGSFSDGLNGPSTAVWPNTLSSKGAIDFAHEFPAKERKNLVDMAEWKLQVGKKDSIKRRARKAAKPKEQKPSDADPRRKTPQ